MINEEMILSVMTSGEVIKFTIFGGGLVASGVLSKIISTLNINSRTDVELFRRLLVFGTYGVSTVLIMRELIGLLNTVTTTFYLL